MTTKQEYYDSITARRNLKGKIAPTFEAVRKATRSAFSGSSRSCVEGHLTVAWEAAEEISGGQAISGEIRTLCEALIQKDQTGALKAWEKAVFSWLEVLDKTWGPAIREHGEYENWETQQDKLMDVVPGYKACIGYAVSNAKHYAGLKEKAAKDKPVQKAAPKRKAAPKAEASTGLEDVLKALVAQGAEQTAILVKVLERVS